MRTQPIPKNSEAKFHIDELFFSTTDPKGIILAGNDVFVRVSGYSSEELVGSPHNIIRHPDMPRAAFWLVWDYLLKGKSVAAYVKNMSADGSYYWVLAAMAPIKGGFLSIRMKPSTPMLAKIEGLYQQLHEIESKAKGPGDARAAALEESKAALMAALTTLGYESYDVLMGEMLLAEVKARKEAMAQIRHLTDSHAVASDSARAEELRGLQEQCAFLGKQVTDLFKSLGSFMTLEKELGETIKFIQQLSRRLRLLALNSQIQAMGLAVEGRPLQVIADQMSSCTGGVINSAMDICKHMMDVNKVLKSAAAQIATSDLSVEMMAKFLDEMTRSKGDQNSNIRREIAQLAEVAANNLDTTLTLVRSSAENVDVLRRRLEVLLREIRTLEILRVSAKAEIAQCKNSVSVSTIFENLYAQTREARNKITFLVDLVAAARIEVPDAGAIKASVSQLLAA